MKQVIRLSIFTTLLGLIASPQDILAKPLEITTVLSTTQSWNGELLPGYNSGQTELKVLRYSIAPGTKTPVHLHPVNGAGYIMSGELTMVSTRDPHASFSDPKNTKKIRLTAGQAWTETVNTWHYGENNGDKTVEFVLVFAGQSGTPPTLAIE